jgi:hypothetical protein
MARELNQDQKQKEKRTRNQVRDIYPTKRKNGKNCCNTPGITHP